MFRLSDASQILSSERYSYRPVDLMQRKVASAAELNHEDSVNDKNTHEW